MAMETRSLKAFSSQPAEEALDTRAIIWHVFCHMRTAIWFSLSWLHPVTLFEVIWGFHRGIYRAIPAITSVLYPRRRRLLNWIRSQVPSKEITDLAAVWRNGGLLCALVEASVAPDPQLGCRFDKYRCSAVPSMKLGQKLAAEYLRVSPEFTEIELEEEMTPAIMARLVEYLSALQHAAVLLKEGCFVKTDEEQPEVTARGMGLVMAVQGRRATFSIYPVHRRAIFNSHFDSLLVQIRGPKEDTGSVLVTQYNSQAHHTPGGLRQIIPIHVTVTIECARITYTPLSSGPHELSLLFRGNHIASSPHKVSVEPRGIHSDLNVIPRPYITKSHILSRTVDFITEKRTLTDDGRLLEISQQQPSFLTRQLSQRKRTKHVMAKRKIIGRRKPGNKSLEDSVYEKCSTPLQGTSDVKIIVHEIEDRRRKSLTPPCKSDFKDSCRKILWMCDLLLKNNSKDKSLRILNTAEKILSNGKDASGKEVAPSPVSEKALCRLRGHLHVTARGLNDVTDLENSEAKKSVIIKGLNGNSFKSNDALTVLPNENFTIESLPMSPCKSQFSSMTNLNTDRRCSEPIAILREKCGFKELDDIVYSDYCIVNFSPISERKSELSTPLDDSSGRNTDLETTQNKLVTNTFSRLNSNEEQVDKTQNENDETSVIDKSSLLCNIAYQQKVTENEKCNHTCNTSETNLICCKIKEEINQSQNIISDKVQIHPTLQESKIMADIAVTNYESILKSTNLEEALKHFDSPKSLFDTSDQIKIEDWMGPAEKEIWSNELKWYESETNKSNEDVFLEDSKIDTFSETRNQEVDIQTCFEDINEKVYNTFLEENQQIIDKSLSIRRLNFKNQKSGSHENKIHQKKSSPEKNTNIFSPDEILIDDIKDCKKIIQDVFTVEDAVNDTKEYNNIKIIQNITGNEYIAPTQPSKEEEIVNDKNNDTEIDDDALAIIKNFTTSICESLSPCSSDKNAKAVLIEQAEDALLLCVDSDIPETNTNVRVKILKHENKLSEDPNYLKSIVNNNSDTNTFNDSDKLIGDETTNIDMASSETEDFINRKDVYEDKKCFANLVYETDCEQKFNELIAKEQIDSLTSENTEESLKEFEFIYQESIDEIDTNVAKELFPETVNPEIDLLIFQKLKDGMNKLAEATKRLSKSLPHEAFIRDTSISVETSCKQSRSLSIFSDIHATKENNTRKLAKGFSLEELSSKNNITEPQNNGDHKFDINNVIVLEDKNQFANNSNLDSVKYLQRNTKVDYKPLEVIKTNEQLIDMISNDVDYPLHTKDQLYITADIVTKTKDVENINLVDKSEGNNNKMVQLMYTDKTECKIANANSEDIQPDIKDDMIQLTPNNICLSKDSSFVSFEDHLIDISNTNKENNDVSKENIVYATRRLSLSLTRMNNPQECLHVPEFEELLSHSPDIASIGTPDKSQQMSPETQSPDIIEIDTENFYTNSDTLLKQKSCYIDSISNKIETEERSYNFFPLPLQNVCLDSESCETKQENSNTLSHIRNDNNFNSCLPEKEHKNDPASFKDKDNTCHESYDLEVSIKLIEDKETKYSTRIPTVESIKEEADEVYCSIIEETLNKKESIKNEIASNGKKKALPSDTTETKSLKLNNKDHDCLLFKKTTNLETKTDKKEFETFLVDSISTLKDKYHSENVSSHAENPLNSNTTEQKSNLDILAKQVEMYTGGNVGEPNTNIISQSIHKSISQDSLTNLIEEIEQDKELYHRNFEKDSSTSNCTKESHHFLRERQNSLVAKRKNFWDEKILSVDDETPIKIETKPRYLPKSPSITAKGIVAKSLKCFEQPVEGCFHARRAWASPNATPEPDTPPPIAPDLISSQHNTILHKNAENFSGYLKSRMSVSSKLSIFEPHKSLSNAIQKNTSFDTPDVIKTEKDNHVLTAVATYSTKNHSVIQSFPNIKSKPLERRSIEILQDSNILHKDMPNKVHKKFSYESNRFSKRSEEVIEEPELENFLDNKNIEYNPNISLKKRIDATITSINTSIIFQDKNQKETTVGNTLPNINDAGKNKNKGRVKDTQNLLFNHASLSADSNFHKKQEKDIALEKSNSLGSTSAFKLSIKETIDDDALKQRKGSVALTKKILDQNLGKSQRTAHDQSLYHTVKYTTGETKIAIVPPREKSLESKHRPRRMSLLKMFSIEVTPSLEIETNTVNPLCDLNADETLLSKPQNTIPLKIGGETQQRFNTAKSFFKTLELKDIKDDSPDKKTTRGSSLGRIGGLRTAGQRTAANENMKKFCSERQPKSVERFHVRDLFKNIEDKAVGARGIPNPLAVVASLNSAVAESQPVGLLSPYDLAKDEDTELPQPEVLEEEAEENIEPESTGLQRRGSLERRLSFKRLSERSTAEMF